MIDVQKGIAEGKSVLEQERPCKACIFSNEPCTWCIENKIPITPFMRGCNKYMTNEQAVRKVAEAEAQRHQKSLQRMMLNMDVMAYMVNGASLVLEKVDKELEESYEAIEDKDSETIRNHAERKRNRERLYKAYKAMKFSIQDIRNTFNNYVEHYFDSIFTDEQGKYDFKESDKNLVNSGVVAEYVSAIVDRVLDNGENATSIMNHILSLPGANILDERDFGRLRIKK